MFTTKRKAQPVAPPALSPSGAINITCCMLVGEPYTDAEGELTSDLCGAPALERLVLEERYNGMTDNAMFVAIPLCAAHYAALKAVMTCPDGSRLRDCYPHDELIALVQEVAQDADVYGWESGALWSLLATLDSSLAPKRAYSRRTVTRLRRYAHASYLSAVKRHGAEEAE